MQSLKNIWTLILKEWRSLFSDGVMGGLLVIVFTVLVYQAANGIRTDVKNATVGVLDLDQSTLSHRITDALPSPWFARAQAVSREEIDAKMIDALRQHLQSIGKYSEDSEQQLTQLQNSYLISRVKNALLSDGYDANSIATAMAYVTAINYGITQHLDLSSVKAHPMVGQIQDAMDKDSYLRNLSDADKQRIADTYYWIGSLQTAMYMEAANAGDQQALNDLAKEANAVLTSFGLSTAQIREGSNGLEIHR